MIKTINDDALKVIDKLQQEKKKVDCIITDPPFNLVGKIGSIHLFRQAETKGGKGHSAENMSYDVDFDQTTYLKKLQHIIKKGGNLVIFNDWENLGLIAQTLRENGFNVKQIGHWQKTNPLPSEWRRRIVAGREYFLHAIRKGDRHTFNTDVVWNGVITGGLTKKTEKKYGYHPNQKPLYLLEKLINIFTNENDTVLDLFMGSGTTGVSCKQLNRNFIGVELDKGYYEIANKRIENQE